MHRQSSVIREVAGYVLSDRLGSGGMGDVYKAYHPGLNRYAAVKILHQQEMAARFKNEAFIQSSVNHPNIARLYESSLTGSHPCIIMEYVEGECLDQYIRRLGKVPNDAAEKILGQIVSALAYLHNKDILHRDIKPSNFKIQPDGTVKMLDFGIAKHKYSPRLTQQGFIVGTTEYMAPEQFQQHVEKQSDIWSLGVMLYEMLTGHLPFEAVNPIVLQGKICKASFTDPMILVSTISPRLNTVIEKSLRVNPASRITAVSLKKMLDNGAAVSSAGFPQVNFKSRSGWMIAGVVGLAFIIMMVLINLDPAVDPGIEPVHPVNPNAAESVAGHVYRVRINVPSVTGAQIVFANGETRLLPTELTGKEGERFEFTISANGYASKEVSLGITNRRGAYDYNLDKLNE